MTGYDNPPSAKDRPFTVPDVTTTVAPLALSIAFCSEFAPTTTFPRFMFVGVTVNCPRIGAVPMPLSGMDRFEFDASERIETLPVAFPEKGGVKMILNVYCCPGARSRGGFNPLILNPAPATIACEI